MESRCHCPRHLCNHSCPDNSPGVNKQQSSPRTLPGSSLSLGVSHRGPTGEEHASQLQGPGFKSPFAQYCCKHAYHILGTRSSSETACADTLTAGWLSQSPFKPDLQGRNKHREGKLLPYSYTARVGIIPLPSVLGIREQTPRDVSVYPRCHAATRKGQTPLYRETPASPTSETFPSPSSMSRQGLRAPQSPRAGQAGWARCSWSRAVQT